LARHSVEDDGEVGEVGEIEDDGSDGEVGEVGEDGSECKSATMAGCQNPDSSEIKKSLPPGDHCG
jgi:hypothetical protein